MRRRQRRAPAGPALARLQRRVDPFRQVRRPRPAPPRAALAIGLLRHARRSADRPARRPGIASASSGGRMWSGWTICADAVEQLDPARDRPAAGPSAAARCSQSPRAWKNTSWKVGLRVLAPSPGRAGPWLRGGMVRGRPSTSTVADAGRHDARGSRRARRRSTPACGSVKSRSRGRLDAHLRQRRRRLRARRPAASRAPRTAGTGSPGRPGSSPSPISASQPSSSIVSTPSSSAFFALEPAPGPATSRSVLALTEPATLAPSASARALASARVIFSSVPVKTTVLPATGLSRGRRLAAAAIVRCATSRSIAARSSGLAKAS